MKAVHGLGFALLAGFAAQASALPTTQVLYTYYSNAHFTQEVGSQVRPTCNGSPAVLHGSRTAFYVTEKYSCEDFDLREIRCSANGSYMACPANICDSSLFECN